MAAVGITAQDLYEQLRDIPEDDRRFMEVRAVSYGRDTPSWNRPVSFIREGPNRDFLIIVQSP